MQQSAVDHDTGVPTGGTVGDDRRDPSRCAECGHHREGIAVSASHNRRLLRKGKQPVPPQCSSGWDAGWGDVDQCECFDPAHSEVLVSRERLLAD